MTVMTQAQNAPGLLVAINAQTFTTEDSILLESSTYPAALAFASVWVALEGKDKLLRLPISSVTAR
jgi:hypothetical protein